MQLDDPKDSEAIQETLRSGQATDFWAVLKQVIEASIDSIKLQLDGEDIAELTPDKYKVMVEILKGRKKDLTKLLELPETLIMHLESPDQSEINFDPYSTAEDFAEGLNRET